MDDVEAHIHPRYVRRRTVRAALVRIYNAVGHTEGVTTRAQLGKAKPLSKGSVEQLFPEEEVRCCFVSCAF